MIVDVERGPDYFLFVPSVRCDDLPRPVGTSADRGEAERRRHQRHLQSAHLTGESATAQLHGHPFRVLVHLLRYIL